jgi:hypothetical protein
MKIVGIDIGLSGGISDGKNHYDMPTRRVEVKPAVTVFAKDSKGKKQQYITGPRKGEFKRIIKTPAKYKEELDVHAVYKLLKDADIVVIEGQGTSRGNSAKATRSTSMNFGKLLAIAELCHTDIVIVSPQKWKADLKLSQEKTDSIEMAEKLAKTTFRTERGALKDGPAEAFLVRYWYIHGNKIT